jgi:hypothetical protein
MVRPDKFSNYHVWAGTRLLAVVPTRACADALALAYNDNPRLDVEAWLHSWARSLKT